MIGRLITRSVARGIRFNMKMRRIRDMKELVLFEDEYGHRPYKMVLIPGVGLRVIQRNKRVL